jgi:hypothetical protein
LPVGEDALTPSTAKRGHIIKSVPFIHHFINVALKLVADVELLKPVRNALKTVEKHRETILARWASGHNNARIEAFNGIFQAAKCRARGYRNDDTFITIIYLLAVPIQNLIKST